MDTHPEKRNDWLAQRVPGTAAETPEYPEIDRANRCLAHWMAGYDELEIAAFFNISEIDVARDLQHLRSKMNPRQQVAMNNDRQRILIQKEEARNYSSMLKGALTKGVDGWLSAGLSPVPAMKEYRQAVGLEEKPGGVAISVTKQSATFIGGNGGIPTANFGGRGKIRCFEDLLRMVIAADPTCGLQPVIDTDAQESLPESTAPIEPELLPSNEGEDAANDAEQEPDDNDPLGD